VRLPGIGPFGALAAAGCRLTVGSDSQAVIDIFEEARRIEMYERLASTERGHFTAEALGTAMTWDGHASLGWPEAGEIAPGSLADLVTIRLDSPRLAGIADLASRDAAPDAARPASDAENGPRAHGATGHAEPDLALLEAVIFAAAPADVHNVVVGGRDVVIEGAHQLVPDVSGAISAALRAVLG
jgi:cytosine/adenosine deaminase-related metal-dependent hydrolase